MTYCEYCHYEMVDTERQYRVVAAIGSIVLCGLCWGDHVNYSNPDAITVEYSNVKGRLVTTAKPIVLNMYCERPSGFGPCALKHGHDGPCEPEDTTIYLNALYGDRGTARFHLIAMSL